MGLKKTTIAGCGLFLFVWIVTFYFSISYLKAQSRADVNPKTGRKLIERFVDSIAQPLIKSSKVAGIAVGVMKNDSIILLKAYGFADLEFDVPLPENASFEIGSITKQFTAVAIMQLAENGLVNLDDSIGKYLDIKLAYGVTIRELLNHTSGIQEPRLGDMVYHNYARDTLLNLVQKSTFDFRPGSAMMYNNTGYNILGLLIEKVSGQTFHSYINKNIFSKAGMRNSYFASSDSVVKFRAHGYNNISQSGKLTRAEQPYFHWTFSAGALSSTVTDLFKWSKTLHGSDILLNKRMYRELINPGHLQDGTSLRYAAGLQVLMRKGHAVIGHGGSGSGVLCDMRYFPDQRLTIIVLQNTFRRASESEISYLIADHILPTKKESEMKLPENLSLYTGDYTGIQKISISEAGGQLLIKRPWQQQPDTLRYISDHNWALGDALYTFKLESGKVTELHWDVISAYFRFKKGK